jgi:hypothetical protein
VSAFGRRAFRLLAFVVLAYVTSDLVDASVPGIFYFGSDQLFVDGTLQTKDACGPDESVDLTPDRVFSTVFDAPPSPAAPGIAPAHVARHWRALQKHPAATKVLASPPSDDPASA